MEEKKQNINLYKQIVNQRDKENRHLTEQMEEFNRQSMMRSNFAKEEEVQRLNQEQEDLERLENQLRHKDTDDYREYEEIQWNQMRQEAPHSHNANLSHNQPLNIPPTNFHGNNESYDLHMDKEPEEHHVENIPVVVNESITYNNQHPMEHQEESHLLQRKRNQYDEHNIILPPTPWW